MGVCNHIALSTSFLPSQPTHQNKMLSSKVNILFWRVMNRRIPTIINLDWRGIDIDNVCCPICDDEFELEDHIFAKCCIAMDTWRDVLLWWHISGITITSLEDLLSLADRVPLETKFHQYFDVEVRTTLWHLWIFRNKVSSSQKCLPVSWLEWLCNPCNSFSPVCLFFSSSLLV